MVLREILHAKGGKVYTIDPEATLDEVVRRLVEHNIGSLVVCGHRVDTAEAADLLGIITERDILRACASERGSLAGTLVREAMSTRLITGTPDSPVEEIMGLMTDNRIRHLPVLAEGRLCGIVSIGDVVKAQHDRLAMENRFMQDYIRG
jgi:CBS domain-containing protein